MSQVVRTQTPSQGTLEEPHGYVAGEIIADKYRLVRRIADGGMGSVWVARNLALDVQVAIKLIRSDLKQMLETTTLLALSNDNNNGLTFLKR